MSPDRLELPPLDVPPAHAERIRRRGQRVLARWADPFAQTWLGRVERAWIDRLEPLASGTGAAALVVWALVFVFS